LKSNFGRPWFKTDYAFQKLSADGQLKFRLSEALWIFQRIYLGISSGDLPAQDYFYFFGKNIFENLSFEAIRLVKGAGDMRGYGGRSFKGKNILTINTEIRRNLVGINEATFDILLFYDSGVLPSLFPRFTWKDFKQDAGLGIEFNVLDMLMIGAHFPLWISDPEPNSPRFDYRWVLSLDLTL
jgi:hypothetical protein